MTPVATSYGLGDASPQSITVHKLTGRNFIHWSQSVMMYICVRGKDNFLTGLVPRPDVGDPKLRLWKADNNMVMSWLINSMTPEIGENFLLYPTAKDIWDAAREAYSCKDNSAELFAIEQRLRRCAKVKILSLRTSRSSHGFGSNLICLNSLIGNVPKTSNDISPLLSN
ncbi:hypothetical protein F511_29095 [Dorcoceras hygrometricum]|uniref:Retrotransposon Copia-like N-terminal domain-containing protein n=1 Tax=Dorcoceras hygrometricum TaxID=472368 RepID=A0A2Z7CHJ4_9LAMI|nr:hypothetical protein F511_29095 [Dorcoceras hygrometricum]